MSELAHTHKGMFAALAVAMAIALVFAMAPALIAPVEAKIVCRNPGDRSHRGIVKAQMKDRIPQDMHRRDNRISK